MHPHVANLFNKKQLAIIAGPCVAESTELCLSLADDLKKLTTQKGVSYIFKASFDKANRTSLSSFRGPGIDEGLYILQRVKTEIGVPVLTDIHTPEQAAIVAAIVDILQIPAFLCRQTDLITAAATTGLPVNIKKGQFLAPEDMRYVANKHYESGGGPLAITERGVSFGYHELIVDMRSLVTMRAKTNAAIIFDATHSVQRPSAGNGVSAGDRHLASVLARAAAAVGVDGIFAEVHPKPDQALSDGPNSLSLSLFNQLLEEVVAIDAVCRKLEIV
ncbi:MAG: 3-deoxy-8-phosphooctulonate synthase [Deltaproteobacteria bacterium]|nr:3-deoxy-8-phosphooctulonate synthase [Deltaproteobacteria bacterium]